jgi:hypothetical protein
MNLVSDKRGAGGAPTETEKVQPTDCIAASDTVQETGVVPIAKLVPEAGEQEVVTGVFPPVTMGG